MTTPTQVRIDTDTKNQVTKLFAMLGLDMSSAINLFLHQCLLKNGLPFTVELPQYNSETISAMVDAKKISRDPNVKSYDNIEDLKAALLED